MGGFEREQPGKRNWNGCGALRDGVKTLAVAQRPVLLETLWGRFAIHLRQDWRGKSFDDGADPWPGEEKNAGCKSQEEDELQKALHSLTLYRLGYGCHHLPLFLHYEPSPAPVYPESRCFSTGAVGTTRMIGGKIARRYRRELRCDSARLWHF